MNRSLTLDPLVGKAMAVVRAMEIVVDQHWPQVIFETDLKLLWQNITKIELAPCWKIEALVFSVRACLQDLYGWSFVWIPTF